LEFNVPFQHKYVYIRDDGAEGTEKDEREGEYPGRLREEMRWEKGS